MQWELINAKNVLFLWKSKYKKHENNHTQPKERT